ncbi:MBL fold metallo-hydrolase [Ahrensia marina]|uniref:Beta-lactamase n=1 Tax=Ahrensia marina TaxID=1514904 RepID=A0A0M9GKY6_9HYPH|nr:MBL fold metallo-hydrolase [Ahrensia marina]KPA99878.1 beta-lactamase [Ahrensia marina]
MSISRRQFIHSATALTAAVTLLPYAARAAGHSSDVFQTDAGDIKVHPVAHASFVMETPVGTIYVDTVGEAEDYADFPAPDLMLITHEHGDHYNAETLAALIGENTQIITNPAVKDMLSEELKSKASALANGEETDFNGLKISAIPAYNTTEERLQFHPKGRDNGYVLGFEGFTVYISGDTEDIPEMRALEGIDLAFVCMNLPFTMDVEAAASAVSEFKPTYVYPYHYRGRDNGTQDPAEFAKLLEGEIEAKMGEWYS